MKFSKTILQENLNKNRATNRIRYRNEHGCSRRNSDKSGNRSPTKSNFCQLKNWTKHMKACNKRIQDGKLDATLTTKHSCNITESLPDLPSEIFLYLS